MQGWKAVPGWNKERKVRTPVRGFTLVEMLVVITVILVVAALLLPALMNALETARETNCAGNQRQVGVAAATYADQSYGFVPQGFAGWDKNTWQMHYWTKYFAAAGLSDACDGTIRCPKTQSGTYGMAASTFGEKNGQWGWFTDPGACYLGDQGMWNNEFHAFRLNKMENPACFALFGDVVNVNFTTTVLTTGIYDNNNSSGMAERGGIAFWPSDPFNSGGQLHAIWMGHNNRTNVCFADGHVRGTEMGGLMTLTNYNSSSSLNGHGIDAVWGADGVLLNLY